MFALSAARADMRQSCSLQADRPRLTAAQPARLHGSQPSLSHLCRIEPMRSYRLRSLDKRALRGQSCVKAMKPASAAP